MKKRLTPEQETKRAARKAAQQSLFARLAKMNPEERATLAAQMPVVTCEGRTLSVANMCLVALQHPHATVVGGFRQWIKIGRCVKKGEHGIAIRVPCGVRKENDAQAEPGESVFFTVGNVFDVSQTTELETDHPVATVDPEIARAFGMENLPNVRPHEAAQFELSV